MTATHATSICGQTNTMGGWGGGASEKETTDGSRRVGRLNVTTARPGQPAHARSITQKIQDCDPVLTFGLWLIPRILHARSFSEEPNETAGPYAHQSRPTGQTHAAIVFPEAGERLRRQQQRRPEPAPTPRPQERLVATQMGRCPTLSVVCTADPRWGPIGHATPTRRTWLPLCQAAPHPRRWRNRGGRGETAAAAAGATILETPARWASRSTLSVTSRRSHSRRLWMGVSRTSCLDRPASASFLLLVATRGWPCGPPGKQPVRIGAICWVPFRCAGQRR